MAQRTTPLSGVAFLLLDHLFIAKLLLIDHEMTARVIADDIGNGSFVLKGRRWEHRAFDRSFSKRRGAGYARGRCRVETSPPPGFASRRFLRGVKQQTKAAK